jgi:hypothetical protein
MNRPPAPILAVVIVLLLMTVSTAAAIVFAVTRFGAVAVVGLIFPLLTVFAALGLWQATRGSRVITIGLSGFLILAGLNDTNTAVIGIGAPALGVILFVLLVAPASSRAWFASHDQQQA